MIHLQEAPRLGKSPSLLLKGKPVIQSAQSLEARSDDFAPRFGARFQFNGAEKPSKWAVTMKLASAPRVKAGIQMSYPDFLWSLGSVLFFHHFWNSVKSTFGMTTELAQSTQALETKLTEKILDPLLKDPDKTRAMIDTWITSIREKEKEGGVVAGAQILGLTHLQKHLASPDKLKKALHLISMVLVNGGYQKVKKILDLMQTEQFKTAPLEKQGQFVLESLGALYVKAFQTVSSVPDLFPRDIQKTMVKLYEDLTPIPFAEIDQIIQKELGKPIKEIYDVDPATGKSTFEETPLKVGSIAQVHRAKLKGEDVVVKVVKPGVLQSLKDDAKLFGPLIELAAEMVEQFDIREVYKDFMDRLANEANMTQKHRDDPEGEAQHLIAMGEAYKVISNVQVPKVYPFHTSKNVLTMSFVPGRSLLKYQGNPQVAQKYLNLYLTQVFVTGYVQEDPHPGNTLYDASTDKFGCIDAGLASQISKEERLDCARLAVAIFSRNIDLLADAVVKANMTDKPGYPHYKQKLADLYKKEMDKLTSNGQSSERLTYKATLKLISQIAKLAMEEGLEVKEPNPMLWKSLFTGVSVARTLDPNVSVVMPILNILGQFCMDGDGRSFVLSSAKTLAGDYLGDKWTGVTETVKSWWPWGKKTEPKPDAKPEVKPPEVTPKAPEPPKKP